ncbi:3-hydroxyacyl-CoA dehydrogenase NAD-binding domain-containing protein [Deinococcus wulumuqiensis]|uniref:3-hydroxyacyl-CoA dehydrogenase n=1 Tax=Deinococcus wulumuqiensis TaxID=980427 RepID=A0AAV4K4E7_9DEIO|nr:3-hydroxyacyl-CoA dehydrogenase NAD-binding domain-containing protein [Deinococcus wulumuqiensis]QII22074.1 3-hydroxyacyl-CoA dehydrogenase [Deinococcus wulumuqiensis R12]GGI84263.1 3-hydroxyacyl-CoA dehydrogenase [Deinococcus wulumuqiensis]GGP29765.1 3-hydroxyacyl-CoA dehydrogenase [Deinococcus wulumuqiensis]
MSNHVEYVRDGDVATLTMNWPGAVNLMDADFIPSFKAALDKLEADRDSIKGALLRSAKTTFFAGGDLKMFMAARKEQTQELFEMIEGIKAQLRRIEKLGKPVVAVIEGAALGGGFEVALACHHRVVLDHPKIQLGLPEVTLGLLPGGGGVTRMVRHLGVQAAGPYLLEGKLMRPAELAKLGLAELAPDSEAATRQALAWIDAHPAPVQPWDVKGHRIPGGKAYSPQLAQVQTVAPAMLLAKTKGTMPAPAAVLGCAVEGAAVDFDTALRIESRYLTYLALHQVSRNMIGTLFTGLNEIKGGAARPKGVPPFKVQKLGILGAGMMGAGIAYSAATKGIEVVLLDTAQERAEKGKAYSEGLLDKGMKRGKVTEERKAETLGRIKPTTSYDDLEGCDLIIEAVFEDPDIKADVTKKAEPRLRPGGLFSSNTSTIPITDLARSSAHPERFIGLHFFSPVDKMPLLEIIKGKETGPEAVAQALDFAAQIGKTPIVVSDARGFYTSRVFGQYVNEGAAMLAEGIPAAVIENAALQAGMPVGPLAVLDEVTLTLPLHVEASAKKAGAAPAERHPGMAVLERMVELGRSGRAGGQGFYDYPEGQPKRLWSGLKDLYPQQRRGEYDVQELRDRFLYAQAVDAAHVADQGVLTEARELNIGSIMGLGFPVWTGGAYQFIEQTGREQFVARARELAAKHGPRFEPPARLSAAPGADLSGGMYSGLPR